jgi:hypothetical protein
MPVEAQNCALTKTEERQANEHGVPTLLTSKNAPVIDPATGYGPSSNFDAGSQDLSAKGLTEGSTENAAGGFLPRLPSLKYALKTAHGARRRSRGLDLGGATQRQVAFLDAVLLGEAVRALLDLGLEFRVDLRPLLLIEQARQLCVGPSLAGELAVDRIGINGR